MSTKILRPTSNGFLVLIVFEARCFEIKASSPKEAWGLRAKYKRTADRVEIYHLDDENERTLIPLNDRNEVVSIKRSQAE